MKASELLREAERLHCSGQFVVQLKNGGMRDFLLPANQKNAKEIRFLLDKVAQCNHKRKEG